MSDALTGGLLLALASAAALNWSYFVQHGVASALPPLTLRRPVVSLRRLFGNLRWLVGFVVGIGGWVLYVAALALAPLSLVQAASAGGIGLLALLASRHARLTAWERGGVGVAVGGLVLLGVSLTGRTTTAVAGPWEDVAVWIVVSAALAGLAAGRRTAAGLGIAAGVLYAAGDVATKAAVHGGGRLGFIPVLLACHGLAFVALQLGFQRGGVLATAGLATLLTNALPIAAGTTLYDEGLGSLPAVRVIAFACTVVGAALLSGPEPALPPTATPIPFD
jgi:hypothetical protein